jgi:hypothetical protein
VVCDTMQAVSIRLRRAAPTVHLPDCLFAMKQATNHS